MNLTLICFIFPICAGYRVLIHEVLIQYLRYLLILQSKFRRYLRVVIIGSLDQFQAYKVPESQVFGQGRLEGPWNI